MLRVFVFQPPEPQAARLAPMYCSSLAARSRLFRPRVMFLLSADETSLWVCGNTSDRMCGSEVSVCHTVGFLRRYLAQGAVVLLSLRCGDGAPRR